MPGGADQPLSDAEFAIAMARLGPFEPSPDLAIAVSGGADSLALTLLADRWARGQGGRVTALTVDHRLRAEAAAEAAQVGHWLAARGIAHQILVWHGPYPPADIQAAARVARYDLFGAWLRDHHVLHLLTAHHQDDQAETLLLRLGRGSGLAGLAGMAAIAEAPYYRLLRPLLAVPASRLRALLAACGQAWIDDPSNRDPAYARARLRLDPLGLSPQRLADTGRHLGRARMALEQAVERAMAEAVALHPAGFVWLDPAPLAAVPAEIGLRSLAAIIATVSGAAYPPRFERLERLAQALVTDGLGGGRTLGGCRIRAIRGRVLIHREMAAMAPPLPILGEVLWDGRFLAQGEQPGFSLGGLGAAQMTGRGRKNHPDDLPGAVCPTLPALWQGDTLISVPHLGWTRPGFVPGINLRFRPARPLMGSGFTVV